MDEDEDFMEIESPFEQPVDADDDEVDEMVLQPGGASASSEGDANGTDKLQGKQSLENSGEKALPRTNIGMDKPIHYMAKPKDRSSLLHYPNSLPYECETLEEFDQRLEYICQRLIACVQTKSFAGNFSQWNHHLLCLLSLKYPVQQATHARLARLFYHITVSPSIGAHYIYMAAITTRVLLQGRKKLSIAHLVLPWRPLYEGLQRELFRKAREPVGFPLADTLLDLAEDAQRFFDPDEAEAMFEEILPGVASFPGNRMATVVGLLVHMLPITHPQRWLPTIFTLWESFSYMDVDQQLLDLCARIAELHTEDPRMSTQQSKDEMGRFADYSRQELRSGYTNSGKPAPVSEEGLWSDVGIFTEHQFAFLMTKCLRAAGLPIGAGRAKDKVATESSRTSLHPLKKPTEQAQSFAVILVYSMCKDSPSPSSTPAGKESPVGNGAETPAKQTTFLAGSRALDALARYIQATESYFHPSNFGAWAWPLSNFVKCLTWEFSKRWHEEETSECKTPKAFRLTQDIRREFCMTLRTVCLLSMFSKDPRAIAASQASLKRLALLEPEIIMPPVLERAYSSLEALETTHRTSAMITTLSSLTSAMVSRDVYKEGGKHIVPLLHLCIPGIDLNDSVKTMSTAMLVLTICMTTKLDDLTRPELDARENDTMEEEDEVEGAVRLSTAGFEDWTINFFRRVLALFEALPEEGKGGRTGGKIEEHVIQTVLAACDAVCCSMSEYLFDINFKIVADYCSTNVAAQSVRVAGSLISCFARHNPKKVIRRLLRPCVQAIHTELNQGASSVRTTSTSSPISSDVALHWHMSILIGTLTFAGPDMLEYKEDILAMLEDVTRRTYTERGYTYAFAIVQRVILLLVGTYVNDSRHLNPSEWIESENDRNAHRSWGKTYAAKDVQLSWHTPTDDEISLALDILDKIIEPRLEELEMMQDLDVARTKVWSNDFCRKLSLVRAAYTAFNSFIKEQEMGGGMPYNEPCADVPEFLDSPPRFKSGFVLNDPSDTRFQKVLKFKSRFGAFLHLAAQRAQDSNAEDAIDCVKLLIRSIRTYMVSYAFNVDDYNSFARSVLMVRTLSTLFPRQKKYPRVFWARRAAFYHASRGRMNSFSRRRTELDDKLIMHVLDHTMSNYVGIRRTAQNALEAISEHYKGTRPPCFVETLKHLRDSTSDDRIKGALYVLASKPMMLIAISDVDRTCEYVMTLLNAQGHSKPSIQKLLRQVIQDFMKKVPEPSSLPDKVDSTDVDRAAGLLQNNLSLAPPVDPSLVAAVAKKHRDRISRIDDMVDKLTSALLEYARSSTTHWSFAIFATQLLRILVRRDRPLDALVAGYFAQQVSSENPSMRSIAQKGVFRMLYFVKLRTLAKSTEELFHGRVEARNHPLRGQDPMTPPSQKWKKEHSANFGNETISEKTRFYDRDAPGYLVWSDTDTYYLPPLAEKSVFDWTDEQARSAISSELTPEHWSKIVDQMAQEKTSDTPTYVTSVFAKSVFQVYGIAQVDNIKASVENLVAQRDRHKHRAASELLIGVYRGSKHWPLAHSEQLWAWLKTILQKVFDECTPDCEPAWACAVEFMLQRRDPRRAFPLVKMLTSAAKESFGSFSSPYEQAKVHNLLHTLIIALQTKFEPWAQSMLELYSKHFDTDFNEVRELVALNMVDIELQCSGPSFSSVQELMDTCAESREGLSLLSSVTQADNLRARLHKIQLRLDELRAERVSMAKGTSQHDLLALTTLRWIQEMMLDPRNTSMASCVIDLLPTILECANLQDNPELNAPARTILLKQVSIHLYTDYSEVTRLTLKILEIIKQNKESWRKQLDALRMLQVVYFHNIFLLDEPIIADVIETLVALLATPRREVSSAASTTLSGIVLCSQRHMIQSLRQRFTEMVARHTNLPRRGDPAFPDAMTDLHAGILGAIALIGAFPYSVPKWMPSLICDTVARHQDSPDPVGQACKNMAADFKRTHQDTWQEDKEKFTEEQLLEYYSWGGRSDYYA